MDRRSRIFTRRRPSPWPAAGLLLAIAVAAAVYLGPWETRGQLPACDGEQIQREVETMVLVAATESVVLSEAETLDFNAFREVSVVETQGAVYERACATTVRLDQEDFEIRFRIVKDTNAAGYRLQLLET